MRAVGVDDKAVLGGDAVVGQQAIQIFQHAALHRAGADQQPAAAGDIIGEHLLFLGGKIALGRVDQEAGGVLRDGVHLQQREGLHLHILLFDLAGKRGGQLALAVALQQIDLGVFVAGHIVDGRGDGPLPVEVGGVVAAGVGVDLPQIDVGQGDIAALIAAFHHQAVVGHLLVGVLLGEGGVNVGVALFHRDVVGEAVVFFQQVLDDVVLLAGLDDPVDGHILFSMDCTVRKRKNTITEA